MSGRDERATLAVYLEDGGRYRVADSLDAGDWLAEFTDGAGFNAREWAEGMVWVYNERSRAGMELRPHG